VTQVALTGIGLLSSVGHDVMTTCAAIRAGVQRPHELLYFSVLDSAEQESVPLVARPVSGYTEGYVGTGRWLRLAAAAMADMQRMARLPAASDQSFWASTAFFAVTPALAEGRFDDDPVINSHVMSSKYAATLTQQLGWPIAPQRLETIAIGHAGAIEAVARAARIVASGEVARVIVACSDSYLDPPSLEWLDGAERLKSDDNPFGLIPGEAGVCFMLESPVQAGQRGAPIVAYVEAWNLVRSPQQPLAGDPMLGQGLAQALEATLAAAGLQPFGGMSICDLNGEPWRSQDWGAARVRLGGRFADEVRWVFPADSLGDTGSASAAVGLCVAAQALRRGYAGADAVLISATCDDGMVGTACVRSASAH
jgi:3-oxoacyl-[acyl-carrier-protein] synthase-1